MFCAEDFKRLPEDGAQFEALVCRLLEEMGYRILERPAVGGDGGRDVLVERTLGDSMNEHRERVVVQCKHNAHSNKSVNDANLGIWQNAMTRYSSRGYLLVTDTRVTENIRKTFQQFTEDRKQTGQWASYWDVDSLVRHIRENPSVMDEFFPKEPIQNPVDILAHEISMWLRAIRYEVSESKRVDERTIHLVASIEMGAISQRVIVRCIDGEIRIRDVDSLDIELDRHQPQGWIISDSRVSTLARERAASKDGCQVFDLAEFLRTLVWKPYVDSLTQSDESKSVRSFYIDIGCHKTEIVNESVETVSESYDSLDQYIDTWLLERSRVHLSLLGEFGSGKSWFCRHFALRQLDRYFRDPAHQRFPLLITLRNFTKSLTAQQLINDALLEQYKLPFVGSAYDVFQEMNRRGKLLLILDGFDEMARRTDNQTVVDNFWELAKLVEDESKVILTSRTEYFRWAKESESILSGEVTGRSLILKQPKFEVVYLNSLTDDQILEIVEKRRDSSNTAEAVPLEGRLMEMARKPIVLDLLLAALQEVDGHWLQTESRVYLYSTQRLLLRNINTLRSFTGAYDKLFFLCELAWEMIATGELRIHYSEFPQRIKRHFPSRVFDSQELDTWDFDLRNQTLLHRDSAGYYEFAHKSLAEYFLAWKFAAELGLLDPSFVEPYILPESSHLAPPYEAKDVADLVHTFGASNLRSTKMNSVLNFLADMLVPDRERVRATFDLACAIQPDVTGYTSSNLLCLCVKAKANLAGCDLSGRRLEGDTEMDFTGLDLSDVNFSGSTLEHVRFELGYLNGSNFSAAEIECGTGIPVLSDTSGSGCTFFDGSWVMTVGWKQLHIWNVAGDKERIDVPLPESLFHVSRCAATPSASDIYLSNGFQVFVWNRRSGFRLLGSFAAPSHKPEFLRMHTMSVSAQMPLLTLVSSRYGISGQPTKLMLWNYETGAVERSIDLATEPFAITFSRSGDCVWVGGRDGAVSAFQTSTGFMFREFNRSSLGGPDIVYSLSLNPDDSIIAIGSSRNSLLLCDLNNDRTRTIELGGYVGNAIFSPDGRFIATNSGIGTINIMGVDTGEILYTYESYTTATRLSFSADSRYLAICSDTRDARLLVVDVATIQPVLDTQFCVDLSEMLIEQLAAPVMYLKMFRDRGAKGFPDEESLTNYSTRQLLLLLNETDRPSDDHDLLLNRAREQLYGKKQLGE